MAAGAPDDFEREELLDDERVGGSKTRFMVSLGKPQLAALREYAGRKGLSIAEVLRRAVDEFLERRSGGSAFPHENDSRGRVNRGEDRL